VKAYVLGTQEGISSLTLTERPDPVAGPGEAVLKVRLACLNNRDIQILEGRYGAKKAEDRIPLAEGLGEVVSVGDGVTQVAVGDRAVCPHFVAWHDGPFDMSYFGKDLGTFTDGWAAEYIKVPAGALVKVPESLTDEAAAPLAAATLTAWHAVSVIGEVKAGDLVLALGTGGVSMAALQIAKANGVRMITWAQPDEILLNEQGQVAGMRFAKTQEQAGQLTATGDTFEIAGNAIFKAIGQGFAGESLRDATAAELARDGERIHVNEMFQTSLPNVYAGGDCVKPGQDLTVQAVQHGKLAAHAIHQALAAQQEAA